ncbi:hypothetical protein [Adhaeribacter arboris]|uniref:hypothetical protein n=1 Tax=Adhaeribacter arboris TaxID=2072846 RepID=UPI0011B23A2E|nr:hypothetical protein [Adhaeribacter arboris]
MVSPIAKRNIAQIIPIGLIWFIFSLVYSLLERGLLGKLNYYPATGNPYNFSKTFFITAAVALIIGLLVGTIEVLNFYKVFRQKSFIQKIGLKTLLYLGITILFLFLTSLINNALELKTTLLDERVWTNIWAFFSNYAFWGVEVYIAAIIGVSLFTRK